MGALLVGKILFSVNRNFVQSSKRSAGLCWPTEAGSRLDEIVLRSVRHLAERR